MQIHHLEVERTYENTIDPRSGKVVRRLADPVLAPAGTVGITFGGEEYRRQPDGTFEVPAEVGAYYLKQDGWFVGENPFAEQLQAAHDTQVGDAAEQKAADEARAVTEEEEARAREAASKKPPKAA